jgi:hypothetical protein
MVFLSVIKVTLILKLKGTCVVKPVYFATNRSQYLVIIYL